MKTLARKELETLPVYVPGKPVEDVLREYGIERAVKLASNENPLGASPKAVEAVKQEAERIFIYPDPAVRSLREKISEKFDIGVDHIMVGNGGESLIQLVAQSFIEPGDEAVVPDPSFSLYEISVKHMGGVVKTVPMTGENYEYDLEGILKAITDKTKIVYLCNPNNPTGTIIHTEELKNFVQKLPEDLILFLDEAYFEFAMETGDYPDGLEILRERKNTIVLRTFAKVCGIAGLRVGYIFSDPSILEEITKSRGVFTVNRLAQVAAIAALEDQEHIQKSVALNKASLQQMMDFFDENGFHYVKPGGNFIWVNIKRDTKEAYVELQKEGVIIRPGFLWNCDEWLRISSGTMEETEILIEALEKILL